MSGFEAGRRRPLQRRVEKEIELVSPIYANMFEEDEISFLQIKDKAQDLKRSISNSNKKAPKRKKNAGGSPESNPHKVLAPIEVDLHIYELVDSTAGMDNFAMLQLQLDTVRKTMRSHCRRIGQKIIFIHGKGDGVLRKEVRKLLSKEYASCDLQDASFLKYGFGATEVTVRQS